MPSALKGAASQLQSYVRIRTKVGMTPEQLGQLAAVLDKRVDAEFAARTRDALAHHLTGAKAK